VYQFSQITSQIDTSEFDCGNLYLNEFLQKFALQNQIRRLGNTYLLQETIASPRLIGYYTLTFCHIDKKLLSHKFGGNLPLQIAAIKLARLAVAKQFQGRKFGEILLADAMTRAYDFSINFGGYVLLVDAKPEAKGFYEKYRFKLIDCIENNYIFGIRTKDIASLLSKDHQKSGSAAL